MSAKFTVKITNNKKIEMAAAKKSGIEELGLEKE